MACCHIMSMLDVFLIDLEFVPISLTSTSQSVPKVVFTIQREGWFAEFYMATSSKPDSAESYQCPSNSSSSRIDKNSSTLCDAELSTCDNSTKPLGQVSQQDPSLKSGASLAAFENPGLTNETGFQTPSLENPIIKGVYHVADNADQLGSVSLPPFKRARISQGDQPGYAAHAQQQKPSSGHNSSPQSQVLATSETEPGMTGLIDRTSRSLGLTWWLAPKVSTPQSPLEQEDRQDLKVGTASNPSEQNESSFVNKEIDFMFQHPAQNHENLSAKQSGLVISTSYDKSARNFSQGGAEHKLFSQKDSPQHWLASSVLGREQVFSKSEVEQSREPSAVKLGGMLGDTRSSSDTNRRSFVQWRPSVCDASNRVVDGPLPQVNPVQGWNQQRTLQVTQVTSGTSFCAGRPGQGVTDFNQFFPGMLPPRGFVPYLLPGLDVPASAFAGIQSHLVSQGQRVHVPEPKAFMPFVSEGFMPHINYDVPLSRSAPTAHKSFASSILQDYQNKIVASPGHSHAPPGPSVRRPAEQAPVVAHDVLPSIAVVMEGQSALGRIRLEEHSDYSSFARAIRMMFASNVSSRDLSLLGGTCDLENAIPGCRIAYEDDEGDLLLVGDLPWRDFVRSARHVKVVPLKSKGKH